MEINEIKDRLAEEGYCIFEGLLDPKEAERLDGMARSIMESMGSAYISLEGSLNEIPELAPLCTHPLILEIAEAVLGEGYFLANNAALKWCKPGTPAGGLHADWPSRGALAADPSSLFPLGTGFRSSGCSATARRRTAPRGLCLSVISRNGDLAETAIRRRCRSRGKRALFSSITTDFGTDPARTRQPTNIACWRTSIICRRCCTGVPRLGP